MKKSHMTSHRFADIFEDQISITTHNNSEHDNNMRVMGHLHNFSTSVGQPCSFAGFLF